MAVQHTHTTHWGPLALTKVEGWNETMVGRGGGEGGVREQTWRGGGNCSGGRGRASSWQMVPMKNCQHFLLLGE